MAAGLRQIQDAIEHLSQIGRWTSRATFSPFAFGQQEDELLPLRLGDICRILPLRMNCCRSSLGQMNTLFQLFSSLPIVLKQLLRTHLGGNFPLSFERIAINKSQIEQYDLPTKPRKTTERRRLDITETVEAEAMPAHTMRVLVRDKIESYLDLNALRVAKDSRK